MLFERFILIVVVFRVRVGGCVYALKSYRLINYDHMCIDFAVRVELAKNGYERSLAYNGIL